MKGQEHPTLRDTPIGIDATGQRHETDSMSGINVQAARISVEGTRLNRQRIDEMLGRSLMLVTALSPIIGYDKASAIAHKANDEGLTLKEAALQSGEIDERRFDERIVDRKKMVGHTVGGS